MAEQDLDSEDKKQQQEKKESDEAEKKESVDDAKEVEVMQDAQNVSDEEWKKILTEDEYNVLRTKQTEPWNTGEYNDKFMPKQGYYACKACRNPLYSWSAKYESGCGWPAFSKCFKNSIKTQLQHTIQVEILCANCGGHLGHVFRKNHYEYDPDFQKQRHCVNSISIKYIDKPIPKDLQQNEEVLDLGFMKGTWR